MILEKIQSMLRSCNSAESRFPPTELYNEGWLLRIFLDWFSEHQVEGHVLSFADGARWYSEARLTSAFLPRHRSGDPLGETHTHADGVIGHFEIGSDGRTDLSLRSDATQFVVLEAKMFSKLSCGVTHAPDYDQAARTVACMAEAITETEPSPRGLRSVGFYVLAPREQIDKGTFGSLVMSESIEGKVRDRVAQYGGKKDQWLDKNFLPFLNRVNLGCKSWEEIINAVSENDPTSGREISQFYEACLKWNGRKTGQAEPEMDGPLD